MKKSADGDLTVKSEINSKDEFGSLSTSFNIMMEKLNLSYEELSSTYEQLSATEEELRAQYDELQHSEEALRNSEDRYKLALENANDAIWEWDVSAGRFYTSDKWEGIIGGNYNDKSKLSNILEMVIYPEDLNMVRRELYRHIHGESPAFKVEFRLKAKEDGYKWAYARGKAIRDDSGKILKVTGSVSDISEAKNAARKIEHMAYYDSLTGLPNRAFFINKLDEQIDAAKSKGSRGAIMYIDVDNFKNINDTLGHEYGDMLLKELSRRLDSIKGEGDTIYRLGGDEFGILRTTEEGCRSIRDFSKEVLGAIMENFDLSGKNVFISGSIGVALYPEEGDSSGLLMKNADMAMYKAKEKGKNRYELFDNNMYNTLEKKLRIEEILRDALSNSGFYLLYQPQYDILTRKVVGFEALLRLRQEKYGFISPGEFIPIAEESGLIIQIGEWVLREACRKNVSWRKLGYEYESISVNISSVQIQSPGFVEMVEAVLKETGLPPKWLELEITESVLMQSIKYSIEVLNRLKDMGIRLSLDDFGTGYSSLNYLKMMPMNTLKMDKTFIDGICLNKKEEIIADAIVDMAHTMELTVIAEGVETEEQLNLLSKHSCDRVQGFLLNKPLTEEKAEELLKVTSGT
ncbi:MAG: EAL domain-containing protein, partial [Bacillota bacterium]|nr:EAL domain-containing protein [Bacillota bacterium]